LPLAADFSDFDSESDPDAAEPELVLPWLILRALAAGGGCCSRDAINLAARADTPVRSIFGWPISALPGGGGVVGDAVVVVVTVAVVPVELAIVLVRRDFTVSEVFSGS
jgi:hypothetical protein